MDQLTTIDYTKFVFLCLLEVIIRILFYNCMYKCDEAEAGTIVPSSFTTEF
jgi:hypothetical protein